MNFLISGMYLNEMIFSRIKKILYLFIVEAYGGSKKNALLIGLDDEDVSRENINIFSFSNTQYNTHYSY